MAMPLSVNKANHKCFSAFLKFGFAIFSLIYPETLLCSVRNHEVSTSFKFKFKVKSSAETLWLPDNTDGLPQYYIVNFFRLLPKSNLQIVAEVISIRDLC